mmetsp:Transcript_13284/g.27546  ORF Transcript_13284/g.27546 Transcript_13284/m.27546 type:complete len:101 (-) Transcript_13284:1000-1302(-)
MDFHILMVDNHKTEHRRGATEKKISRLTFLMPPKQSAPQSHKTTAIQTLFIILLLNRAEKEHSQSTARFLKTCWIVLKKALLLSMTTTANPKFGVVSVLA